MSQYSYQSYQAFEYFVTAGQIKPAYDMAMRDLAPEAAIRNDYALLTNLFSDKGFDGLDDWTFRGKVSSVSSTDPLFEKLTVFSQLYLQYADCMSKLPDLLLDVAMGEEDPVQARELERLSRAVPQLLGLLPEMFPDKTNIRQQICLGNMISSLMQFLPALKHRGMVSFIENLLVFLISSHIIPPDDSSTASVRDGRRIRTARTHPSHGTRSIHDCYRSLCLKMTCWPQYPVFYVCNHFRFYNNIVSLELCANLNTSFIRKLLFRCNFIWCLF